MGRPRWRDKKHSKKRACPNGGKRRFKDMQEAKETREWQEQVESGWNGGRRIKIYQCPHCRGYHYTNRD